MLCGESHPSFVHARRGLYPQIQNLSAQTLKLRSIWEVAEQGDWYSRSCAGLSPHKFWEHAHPRFPPWNCVPKSLPYLAAQLSPGRHVLSYSDQFWEPAHSRDGGVTRVLPLWSLCLATGDALPARLKLQCRLSRFLSSWLGLQLWEKHSLGLGSEKNSLWMTMVNNHTLKYVL